jgi:hypothetical protein
MKRKWKPGKVTKIADVLQAITFLSQEVILL